MILHKYCYRKYTVSKPSELLEARVVGGLVAC